jgi:hypothetical protein
MTGKFRAENSVKMEVPMKGKDGNETQQEVLVDVDDGIRDVTAKNLGAQACICKGWVHTYWYILVLPSSLILSSLDRISSVVVLLWCCCPHHSPLHRSPAQFSHRWKIRCRSHGVCIFRRIMCCPRIPHPPCGSRKPSSQNHVEIRRALVPLACPASYSSGS